MKSPRPQSTMTYAENALDALGNPTRRQILQILARGPRPVGAIAAELPVSRPAVSKHLRILRAAALVVHESQGTQNVFRLRKDGFDDTAAWLGDFEAPARAAQSTTPGPMLSGAQPNGSQPSSAPHSPAPHDAARPNGAPPNGDGKSRPTAANGSPGGTSSAPSNGASFGSSFGASAGSEAQRSTSAPLHGIDRHEG